MKDISDPLSPEERAKRRFQALRLRELSLEQADPGPNIIYSGSKTKGGQAPAFTGKLESHAVDSRPSIELVFW